MKALAEPLLPTRHAVDQEKAAWTHAASLLWRLSRPRCALDCVLALVVLVLTVASKLLNVALPLVLRRIINTLSGEDEPFPLAAALVGLYCAVTVAAEGCVQLQQAAWGRLFFKITQRVSLALFEHLHALSLRWHLNRKTCVG